VAHDEHITSELNGRRTQETTMNTENDNNVADDAEGHAMKFRPAPEVDPAEDTEGHAIKSGRVPEVDPADDTEGHMGKFRP